MNVNQILRYVLREVVPKTVKRDQKAIAFLNHVTNVFLPGQDGVEDDPAYGGSETVTLGRCQCVLLRRGHSDWSASSGQPSYYFLWPAASGRARTECDIVLISLC